MCTKCFQYFLAHRKHIKWTNEHMGRINNNNNNNLRLIFLLFGCVNCLMDYGQWLEPFQMCECNDINASIGKSPKIITRVYASMKQISILNIVYGISNKPKL